MGTTSDINLINVEPTPTSKHRRKKSIVWDHFNIEVLADGSTRACCNLCKQMYAYNTGPKLSGTSHLKRHILRGSCPKIQERNQLALTSNPYAVGSNEPPKKRGRKSLSFYNTFDKERCCSDLAKMIIMHDYQLHMVEQPAFIAFAQSLQPLFRMPDSNAIESMIMDFYQKEKQNMSLLFQNVSGRVSFAIGLWTTSQTLGYVSLTGHFIDNDWVFHRRMLNFIMVSSLHSENALSEAIGFSLSDWNIKSKLFTITLDNNCSSHDIYSANLRDHLSNRGTLVLKGQLFVVRCYAHTLNMVAEDLIASIHETVYNVRESIKYVKASHAREETFAEIARQLQIPSSKILSLDIQPQWSATYMMLCSAMEFRLAFSCLETSDPNYNESPSSDDWRKVEIVCKYLKLLYDSANIIMETADPTANMYFHEAWKIQLELACASVDDDSTVKNITKGAHEKFDKYWKDCSLVLAIAVVMDPRFKMKLVDFSFTKIYGKDAERYIRVVKDGIHELYGEYCSQPLSSVQTFVEQEVEDNNVTPNNTNAMKAEMDNITVEVSNVENRDTNITSTDNHNENGDDKTGSQDITTSSAGDGLLDFDVYISEMTGTLQSKSELEQYLEEALVPRIQEFDILYWWKLNTLKYPTLSKMARDILAIPMSMVSSGSMFGMATGSRFLDEYRSSLCPKTVEALFCCKDWLHYSPTMTEAPSSTIVKLEG